MYFLKREMTKSEFPNFSIRGSIQYFFVKLHNQSNQIAVYYYQILKAQLKHSQGPSNNKLLTKIYQHFCTLSYFSVET